ncbi:MAG: ABC transporter ATP-binding protein [Solirubrobacteraceae bacterium]|nr:ABC transporter ATP-binding protein [Solirubrobacteraceae bacterium]
MTRTSAAPEAPASAGGAPQASGIAVVVEGVTKTYETRDGTVEAVRDVSFRVPPGHVASLVGPSGCGKSTVLKMIAGLVSYDRGTVEVGGAPAAAGRRDCGIMLQSAVLLPWRSVWDNVMLPIEVLGLDKEQGRERARALLELVGLSGFENKHPWELSGGMQQRASLARLLVFEPRILLMDEPFAALDEFTRERLDGELLRLQERFHRTLVYVTHNIAEAVTISDTVVVMTPRPGEVVDIVQVDLPRPRSLDVATTPAGLTFVNRIRSSLDA